MPGLDTHVDSGLGTVRARRGRKPTVGKLTAISCSAAIHEAFVTYAICLGMTQRALADFIFSEFFRQVSVKECRKIMREITAEKANAIR